VKIAVVGSGGVGGYFGGRLAAAGTDVAFIARGAHLAALAARGLTIHSPQGDALVRVKATDDPAAIGPVDIVLFAVKLYDTEAALSLLPPLLGPATLVIPLQNGVDSVEMLRRTIGSTHAAGGTAYVAAVIAEPGVIRHTAMGSATFGLPDGSRPAILDQLAEAFQRAGLAATVSERITVDIWAKFAQLTVFSGITALTRCPIGVVRSDPDLVAMMESALRESIAVARCKQIPLSHGLFDKVMNAMATLPPNARSSMLEDLERGRPLELPWLSGAVVRIAEEVGVSVPTHRLFVTVLKPHVHGAAGSG
jgi:2-dehydropantoate 2-reductase